MIYLNKIASVETKYVVEFLPLLILLITACLKIVFTRKRKQTLWNSSLVETAVVGRIRSTFHVLLTNAGVQLPFRLYFIRHVALFFYPFKYLV